MNIPLNQPLSLASIQIVRGWRCLFDITLYTFPSNTNKDRLTKIKGTINENLPNNAYGKPLGPLLV